MPEVEAGVAPGWVRMCRVADICFMPARELAALVRGREISAVEVLEAFLDRIATTNPAVNAIVTLEPDAARKSAEAADKRAARGEPLGALHGLPLAVKDLEETAGIRTTMGSPIFSEHVPQADSHLVTRLKRAGAVVIGKTNTPEFGAGSHTFNRVFGPTRNPYDLRRSAGGSSGGAAAAVACGMLPLADGSDLGGSLRNPASFCNVVGVRPSPGLVPVTDAADLWDPMSVHGPIARSVDDAAFLLSAMAGTDRPAPLTFRAGHPFDRPRRPAGPVRVAWSGTLGGLPVEPAAAEVLEARRTDLQAIGWQVDEVELDLAGADEAFEVLRALAYVSDLGDLYETSRHLMKDTVVWNIEQGLALGPERIARALRFRSDIFRSVAGLLADHDVLAAPAAQVLPFPVEVEWPREVAGRRMTHYIEWMRACSRVTVSSHPALSVPAGFAQDGLPVGLQLVGGFRRDADLLGLASVFEEATGYGRVRPPAPADADAVQPAPEPAS